MGRGKTKYALIWWVNTPYKDVVKLSQIPKKCQCVNAITPLVWQNHTTKQKMKTDAKILAIDMTKESIMIQEALLLAMKKAYEEQEKMNAGCEETFKIPPELLRPSENMVEISPDWRQLVREVLLDVYGSSLSNYSATGKKSSRPGINHQLFKGLYDWINSVSPVPISKTMFINAINKAASNKRKYQCVKSQNKKQKVATEKENVN
ncbi:hypothetical protein PV327_011148, partial [Microctonus hyperodae]